MGSLVGLAGTSVCFVSAELFALPVDLTIEIQMMSRRYLEGEYCLSVLTCERKISRSDDVHADEGLESTDQILALSYHNTGITHSAGQEYIHKIFVAHVIAGRTVDSFLAN